MNIFDRTRLMLEAEIDTQIGNYLKNFSKEILDKYESKLAQGYKVGMKFDNTYSASDLKAVFDLWDPFDKVDVKAYKVANIKSAKDARAKIKATEQDPEKPDRADYDDQRIYDQAMQKYNSDKAMVSKKKNSEGYKAQYDDYGFPNEMKFGREAKGKISKYIEKIAALDITSPFTTKDETNIKNISKEVLDLTEQLLASAKIFSMNDFKKTPEKGNPLEKVFKAYEAAKKKPLEFKELTDLKRAIVKVKRQGTHTDTDVATAKSINNELYDNPTGRTDADRNKVAYSPAGAVGDLAAVSKLNMNVPADVKTLQFKVLEILKSMGLTTKGGAAGFKVVNLNKTSIDKYFLGDTANPAGYDPDQHSDVTKLFPNSPEERADFSEALRNAKKLINWFPAGPNKDKDAKVFTDIPNEDIKKIVMNIQKNGIMTLINLKNKVTASDAKSGVVDKVGNEAKNIKDDLEKMRQARDERRAVVKVHGDAAKPASAIPTAAEILRRKREQ